MRLKRILRFVQILYDKTHLLRHECPCPYIVPGMRQGFIQFMIPFYPPRQGADGATCSSIGAIEACQIFLFISRDTKAIFKRRSQVFQGEYEPFSEKVHILLIYRMFILTDFLPGRHRNRRHPDLVWNYPHQKRCRCPTNPSSLRWRGSACP